MLGNLAAMTFLRHGATPLALLAFLASPAQGADLFGEPVVHDAPAAAHGSAISGRLELRGTYLETETAGVDATDAIGGTLTGSVNARLGQSFNAQLDLRGMVRSADDFDSEGYGGTVHLSMRPEGRSFAVGVFGGIEALRLEDFDLANNVAVVAEVDTYLGGVEMAYLGRAVTLLARLGYGEASTDLNGFEISADRYVAELGARYYVTPNVRLDLSGAAQRLELAGASADRYAIEAAASWRPNGGHYSLFGGMRRDRDDDADVVATGFFGGARFHFGTGTLLEEDRSGALWSPLVSLE